MYTEDSQSTCIQKILNPHVYRRFSIHMYTEDFQSTCIQKILNPHVLPNANIKWENKYDNDINWGTIWGNLKKKHM